MSETSLPVPLSTSLDPVVNPTVNPALDPAPGGAEAPASLMQALRQQTRAAHDAVEQAVDLPRRLRSLTAYQDVLRRFYGLYAPLEAALAKHYAIDLPELGMATRWKTPWLVQDLVHFDIAPDAVPCYTGTFPLFNRAALLGVLYVIEGSSLGGQLIRRDLEQHHGLTPETGARFFTGYGDQISAQWRGFGQAVNTLVCAYDARYTLDAAAATFGLFERWMTDAETRAA